MSKTSRKKRSLEFSLQEKKEMLLSEHLLELRRRLLYVVLFFIGVFGCAYAFSEEIFGFLVKPLQALLEGKAGRRLIYTGLAEAFLTYVRVSFFTGLFLSFPLILMQAWLFISPGLYGHEKKKVFPFLWATPLLFGLGAAFAYYFIIPKAWAFFLHFETLGIEGSLPIQLEARVAEYLSLVMQLLLAFGICFQLPVVLVFLAYLGFLSKQNLIRFRRYAVILILILSAIVTPPDVLSMIGLAIPLYLLYELSILLVYFMEKRHSMEKDHV